VPTKETTSCPYCKEEINAEASRCKHCGSTLPVTAPKHGGTCPYCKESIHIEAIKCKHCGGQCLVAVRTEGQVAAVRPVAAVHPKAMVTSTRSLGRDVRLGQRQHSKADLSRSPRIPTSMVISILFQMAESLKGPEAAAVDAAKHTALRVITSMVVVRYALESVPSLCPDSRTRGPDWMELLHLQRCMWAESADRSRA